VERARPRSNRVAHNFARAKQPFGGLLYFIKRRSSESWQHITCASSRFSVHDAHARTHRRGGNSPPDAMRNIRSRAYKLHGPPDPDRVRGVVRGVSRVAGGHVQRSFPVGYRCSVLSVLFTRKRARGRGFRSRFPNRFETHR